MKKHAAFTLVEVLISIFILSIMSVAALASFQQMIKAREIQKSHEAVLTSLSFAYTTMLNDISQQMNIRVPLSFTEREILFERVFPESDTAIIRYTWDKDMLLRHVDRLDSQTEQTLLKNARAIQWQWLSEDTWHDISVPLNMNKKAIAFKLMFTDPIVGDIVWIFTYP